MKRRGVLWACLVILVSGALLAMAGVAVATPPHEDPETAPVVYGGVALLRYYAGSLDLVLQKDAVGLRARQSRVPFVNVPEAMRAANAEFGAAAAALGEGVVAIDAGLVRVRALTAEWRLAEAGALAGEVSGMLARAYAELARGERAVRAAGIALKVNNAPVGSPLALAHAEVQERLALVRQMLDLYGELLRGITGTGWSLDDMVKLATGMTLDEFLKATGLTAEDLFRATALTLRVEPPEAFVGEEVMFEGRLTSVDGPLGGREVDILLNGSRYASATADSEGRYSGALRLPYRYVTPVEVQALFSPQDSDVALYQAALSLPTSLTVLFYPARLELKPPQQAYPGRETEISGTLTYDGPAPEGMRNVEVYLDDTPAGAVDSGGTFVARIMVPSDAAAGWHSVTAFVGAAGRYAPAQAAAALSVALAEPLVALTPPRVVMMPGRLDINGSVYSEIGPASRATVRVGLGASSAEVTSSETGAFSARLTFGLGVGLLGSERLSIEVIPLEPWHAGAAISRSVPVVNWVNCLAFLAVMALAGVYLPSRLRVRRARGPRSATRPPTVPTDVSAPSGAAGEPEAVLLPEQPANGPRGLILHIYRSLLRLVLAAGHAVLRPQQTLREFSRENARALGPGAGAFTELTRVVERLLYSRHQPTDADVAQSERLSREFREAVK